MADRLAGRLQSLGVGPEDCVGLLLPRSPELIAAILAILKLGAAYVPLDPDQPPARSRFMIADAAVRALVTTQSHASPFTDSGVPTVLVDADDGFAPSVRGDRPATDRPSLGSATDLAYVMYTSGSTGEPKGVLIEHRSIVRLVRGTSYATYGPDRVFVQLAPTAFDASTFEIWGALLHGAKLVIAPEGPLDLQALAVLIASHRVTTLWLTAGLFNEIVESRPSILRGVEEILTGGEPLSPRHIRMAYDRLPAPVRIINGYGPTECTTFACCHPIPRQDPAPIGSIPIGRPIANTTAYVLDDRGDPTPIGVAGELYLGGVGVARGYLNRPELTADRFIADPFQPSPSARLYRTGDRARWRADGDLEFLGRIDNQVKIRGFRVELGEIEAALTRIHAIRQAVVVAREDRRGDDHIVAYLVAEPGAVTDDAVAAELARTLPKYMIPSAFVRIGSVPLTPSGKIDRHALPEPEIAGELRRTSPARRIRAGPGHDLGRAVPGTRRGCPRRLLRRGGALAAGCKADRPDRRGLRQGPRPGRSAPQRDHRADCLLAPRPPRTCPCHVRVVAREDVELDPARQWNAADRRHSGRLYRRWHTPGQWSGHGRPGSPPRLWPDLRGRESGPHLVGNTR